MIAGEFEDEAGLSDALRENGLSSSDFKALLAQHNISWDEVIGCDRGYLPRHNLIPAVVLHLETSSGQCRPLNG